MKTKEVIKELKDMNLQTEVRNDYLFVTDSYGEAVGSINLKAKFEIYIDFRNFRHKLSEDEREKVYVLLTKLAETDPQDREEEQKYYLKHKWFNFKYFNFLNFYIANDSYELNDKSNNIEFKTQFTQAEIDEIKERFNTNLEDFEQIPVVDEEKQ